MGFGAPGGRKSLSVIDWRYRPYNSIHTNVLHCDHAGHDGVVAGDTIHQADHRRADLRAGWTKVSGHCVQRCDPEMELKPSCQSQLFSNISMCTVPIYNSPPLSPFLPSASLSLPLFPLLPLPFCCG